MPHLSWSWLRRRLAWRLCLLFVAGAMLPVALSDWLVISVMDGLAQKMDADKRTAAVRATSRQVLDRIRLGEVLLQSLADAGRDARVSPAPVFDRVWCAQSAAATPQDDRSDASLHDAWLQARPGKPILPEQLAMTTGDPPRVLVATASSSGQPCIGRLAADYLWEPLRNGAEDGVWTVRDSAGRLLSQATGADADGAFARSASTQTHSARLFLGSNDAALEWTFVQATPGARVDWHQQPVLAWLLAVAAGTLLTVGLAGQSRIRRALAPLERLTEGTRRLTKGDASARVDIRRDDELGELADAFNDMAARLQQREAQLYFRAVHDDLTGLTNRFGLHQELQRLLPADGARSELAVLFVDLDRFKDVNDRHGHATGDEVLRQAADRLRLLAGDGVCVARKGGDEFVVVISGPGSETRARATGAGIVAAMAQPFTLPEADHSCGASVGIALCPAHATDMLELLRCADIALYESKNTGRGRFTLFDPALDVELRRRHDLLAALRTALDQRQLVVHFQPRISADARIIESAEALVRWHRPGLGIALPDEFIALAESSGLIDALGLHVLDETLRQLALWRQAGIRLKRISVNVSARQFESGALVARVREALLRHAVAPSLLELEVTESLLCGEVALAGSQLAELRAMGVTIAMDDFGTGYSSMALLRTLPIDVMKIDRAFVRDLETDPNAVAIARTIVTLGRSMHLRLVAEGIETSGQAKLLHELGCDELQGYLFGRPMPAKEFELLPGLRRPIDAAPVAAG
ncbi:MAG: putative bifunctional diguanylate cyclase/phosphodiesterase [Vitreoscilla sp.]